METFTLEIEVQELEARAVPSIMWNMDPNVN